MTRRPTLTCGLLALLVCLTTPAAPQDAAPRPSRCFAIHVRLNAKPIDGPQLITLRTREKEDALTLEGGCFSVPASVLAQDMVDVLFAVPRSKIDLKGINAGFLTGPWDVELADKKFTVDVGLPKHTPAKEACAVFFHDGSEPERAMSQTRCRTPSP
jgi:hypothetical protein